MEKSSLDARREASPTLHDKAAVGGVHDGTTGSQILNWSILGRVRRLVTTRYIWIGIAVILIGLATQALHYSSNLSAPSSTKSWSQPFKSHSPHEYQVPKFPVPYNLSAPGTPASDPSRSQFSMHNSAAELIPPFDDSIPIQSLPLMAWVIVVGPGNFAKTGEVFQHISCYCMLHNIPLYIDTSLPMGYGHFFTARAYNVAKYLRRYQWVLVTDGDVLIADSTVKPWKIIDEAEDVDVIFADRGGNEVCSCTWYLRNSPGGWSFLRRWIAWGEEMHPNYDNGDLNELIIAGLRPGVPSNEDGTARLKQAEVDPYYELWDRKDSACLNLSIEGHYFWVFLACVGRKLRDYRTKEPWQRWYDLNLFEWTDALPSFKMRVYKEFSGFSRNGPDTYSGQFRDGRLPEDWLYHLHKDNRIPNASMVLCTGDDWLYEPVADPLKMEEFFSWYNPYSYYRCWSKSGRFICSDSRIPTPEGEYGSDDDQFD